MNFFSFLHLKKHLFLYIKSCTNQIKHFYLWASGPKLLQENLLVFVLAMSFCKKLTWVHRTNSITYMYCTLHEYIGNVILFSRKPSIIIKAERHCETEIFNNDCYLYKNLKKMKWKMVLNRFSKGISKNMEQRN